MPRAATPDDPQLAAYLAAGGTLAELCADPAQGSVHDHAECPACRVVDTFAAAPQPVWLQVAPRAATPATCLTPFPILRGARASGPPPVRGPPLI